MEYVYILIIITSVFIDAVALISWWASSLGTKQRKRIDAAAVVAQTDAVIEDIEPEFVTEVPQIKSETDSGDTKRSKGTRRFLKLATGYPVKKWIYVALAWVFGGIGAHEFYAGRKWVGFLYLVVWLFATFGSRADIAGREGGALDILIVVAIFKGIIALTKKPDKNGMICV